MVWKKRMLRFQNFVSKISFDDVDQISLEHMKGNQNDKTLGRGARGWGAGCSCMCNMIFHSMSRFSSRGVAVC